MLNDDKEISICVNHTKQPIKSTNKNFTKQKKSKYKKAAIVIFFLGCIMLTANQILNVQNTPGGIEKAEINEIKNQVDPVIEENYEGINEFMNKIYYTQDAYKIVLILCEECNLTYEEGLIYCINYRGWFDEDPKNFTSKADQEKIEEEMAKGEYPKIRERE